MQGHVAVITGANKGLGLTLVRGLYRRWGPQGIVYLTARDPEKGRRALESLEQEGLHPLFHLLDLTDETSIEALASRIGDEHGGLDLLIQNGAYAARPELPAGHAQAGPMIDTNNFGTHRVLRAFRSLLRPQARLLVVASGFGTLKSLDPRVHDRFDTDRLDLAGLERNLHAYVEAVEQGHAGEEGWPDWVNIPSKVGQVAATRIFAREWAADPSLPPRVLINAVCPGWMITDASRPYLDQLPAEITPRLPDQAAPDVLWAGLLEPGTTRPYGELVQYRQVLPWK